MPARRVKKIAPGYNQAWDIIIGGHGVIGVDKAGARVAKGGRTQLDKFSPSLEELTGLGPEIERDGAIVALSIKCRWSPTRLSKLFGISASRVYQILADYREMAGEDD